MIYNNFYFYSIKILSELVRDILMFPVWWYSRGLVQTLENIWEFLKNREKSLAFFVWVKNLFRPMYGQRDWQGYLISVGMRLVMIILRGLVMLFWLCLSVLALAAWLVLPPFIIFEIIFQLYG